jgi:Trk K+ transport system NAD-binding subunit
MGRVGSGAYDRLVEQHCKIVIGFDVDTDLVRRQQEKGRNVLQGNPSDEDFWEKLDGYKGLDVIMLALPNFQAIVSALQQIRNCGYQGQIAATAKFPDEEALLREAGRPQCLTSILRPVPVLPTRSVSNQADS